MLLSNSQQIREADQTMIGDLGFPGLILMETAGRRAAEEILKRFPDHDRVVILCGPGNNGGDGFVIARYLKLAGTQVELCLSHLPNRSKGDAGEALKALSGSGISMRPWTGAESLAADVLLIDALLGTGIQDEVRGKIKEMIAAHVDHPGPVIAIDLPSGLNADTGHALNQVIPADLTLTFQLPKICHYVTPAADSCGEVVVLDIGIWPEVIGGLGIQREVITGEWVRAQLGERLRSGHKGTFGHAALVGGSRQYAGAIALSGHAALHVGAGLSTVIGPKAVRTACSAMGPEVICRTVKGDEMSGEMWEQANVMGKLGAIGVGPGLGHTAVTEGFLKAFLEQVDQALVIDADALNILATLPEWWKRVPKGSVLTPHPGEMRRLCGREDVNDFRLECAEELAEKSGCTVLLKGAGTIVAFGEGRSMVNPTGNEGMATGGSGDVLTGAIVGFMAQGHSPEIAASTAAFVHGLAGDRAKSIYGSHGVTAGRILEQLGPAILQIIQEKEPKHQSI